MAVLPIVLEGHPVLRRKAMPVEKVTKRVQRLLRDMKETMYEAKGVGLAAPQVNVSERLIVVDAGQGCLRLDQSRRSSRSKAAPVTWKAASPSRAGAAM